MAKLSSETDRTPKCSCKNPKWIPLRLKTVLQGSGIGKVTITFRCSSCNAVWDTKSRACRKQIDMGSTIAYSTRDQTYGEYFKEADNKRVAYLTENIENCNRRIEEIEKGKKQYFTERMNILKDYDVDQTLEDYEENRAKEVRTKTFLGNIQSLIKNGFSAEKAMELLDVPEKDRDRLLTQLAS